MADRPYEGFNEWKNESLSTKGKVRHITDLMAWATGRESEANSTDRTTGEERKMHHTEDEDGVRVRR